MGKDFPQHIGFIIDGNRRWARARGLPIFEGHRRGYEKLKKVGDWCLKRGIKIMTVFVFSTENWRRSKREVAYLMKLLKRALIYEVKKIHKKGIRLQVLGRKEGLPLDLQKAVLRAEKLTKNNKKGILNLALNYGGRAEIIDAVKEIFKKFLERKNKEKFSLNELQNFLKNINEELLAKNLYTKNLPDPDLIIRTSGEQRLSGFLLWQAAYAELYFCSKLWPDFEEEDLEKALKWYVSRERRFGK